MQKLKLIILLVIISTTSSLQIFSQEKSIAIGLGLGLSRGVNEADPKEKAIGPLFGIYGLYKNGFGENFTPEFSFTYYKNSTSTLGGMSEYSTTYLTPELRLRYYFPVDWLIKPYALLGIGAMIYNVNDVPINPDPKSDISGVALSIPAGLGLTYELNSKWALDLNAYYNFSTTDNLNPVWDDILDGNWAARIGVHYTIHEIPKDSDGDGLSDVDEAKYGTDSNNPDSDNDGLSDGKEIHKYKTNPLEADTDKGGIKDGAEVLNDANPLNGDDDILSIPVGGNIIIQNIEFETGKATLTPNSERILDNVLEAMNAAPKMELKITGHTDDTGDRDINIALSKERAETVKKWLVTRGIADSRLSTRGAGPDEPLVPNTSDENRQKNRRVEFSRSK